MPGPVLSALHVLAPLSLIQPKGCMCSYCPHVLVMDPQMRRQAQPGWLGSLPKIPGTARAQLGLDARQLASGPRGHRCLLRTHRAPWSTLGTCSAK